MGKRIAIKLGLLALLAAAATACGRRPAHDFTQIEEPGADPRDRASAADAFTQVTFPFRDAELLNADERDGGYLLAPARKSGAMPLVVFLHGLNWGPKKHLWVTPDARTPNLALEVQRLIALGTTRPFLFAAPSQTKNATSARTLWNGFDLDELVGAVEHAAPAGVKVDRASIVVMGHSGAGCNPQGGLQRVAAGPRLTAPVALLAVDTCMDEQTADAFGAFRGLVWVHFQRADWPRPYREFPGWVADRARRAGNAEPFFTELDRQDEALPRDTLPHDAVLVDAVQALLPPLLPPVPKTAAL
jgi:hypothetical protein